MSVRELTREQMIQLKQWYLTDYLMVTENREPSWGELAYADGLVSDEAIFENLGDICFSPDDFW